MPVCNIKILKQVDVLPLRVNKNVSSSTFHKKKYVTCELIR